MSVFVLAGVGVFYLAYYYFVLRIYNTLGFRLFSLFFLTGLSVCLWWWLAYRDLTKVQQKGVAVSAMVTKKTPDVLEFRFIEPATGKELARTQQGGVSVAELATVNLGQPAPILFVPGSDTVYLEPSYRRQLADNNYFLIFPGVLFLIAICCWIFLRGYRVLPHEGTMYEYVVNKDGKVVLDDAASTTTKAFRVGSTVSKFVQIFLRR